ncbi:hypothetical protein [Lyngbya sp. CCY1209]|uniref:hypothetical protein n=1 Tax=Lyngbya sp. CCY1209 TaxID=2886103 RepID=UPI002D21616C|nr:hypothetical protein [Lyngbya sp. CCY1209]MEB3884029.1 hypothetical protein [Lyngbya sp. CCY1209]
MDKIRVFESAISEWTNEEFPRNILSTIFPGIHKDLRGIKLIPNESVKLRMKGWALAFSSGTTAYFMKVNDVRLPQVQALFADKPDCARYGSLLTSQTFAAHLYESVRIKVVDFTASEYRGWGTDDCRGFIHPRLLGAIDGRGDRAFQFRMVWLQDWLPDDTNLLTFNGPGKSFLAKGTLAPIDGLTWDIVLDRSSIKGNDIECGEYHLPRVAIGNKMNSRISDCSNSWQFNIWFSKEAIAADLLPGVLLECDRLKALQSDQRNLIAQMCDRGIKRAEIAGTPPDRMAQLLAGDKYGRLSTHRKCLEWALKQLRREWKRLAYGGAHRHQSAMAQPDRTLAPDEVSINGVAEGQVLVVTRYPIVNSDGIRKYRNVHRPDTLNGCCAIHPDIAMTNHQCDFDGDALVFSRAEDIPHIAAEVRWAGEEPKHPPVVKREKVPYTGSIEAIVNAQASDSIGLVATWIGVVEASKRPDRHRLLDRLFDALQIEVDSPKSATRFADIYPTLEKECAVWQKAHPVALFDQKRNDQLFLTEPGRFPLEQAGYHVLADAVSKAWSECQPYVSPNKHWRYLFPSERSPRWDGWALAVLDEYHAKIRAIKEKYGESPRRLSEAIGILVETLRCKCPEGEGDRFEACTALWQLQHNPKRYEADRDNRGVWGDRVEKASLVFNLFPDIIGDRIRRPVETVWFAGKNRSVYAGHPLTGQVATLTVRGQKLFVGETPIGEFPDQCKGDKLGSGDYRCRLYDYGNTGSSVEVKLIGRLD